MLVCHFLCVFHHWNCLITFYQIKIKQKQGCLALWSEGRFQLKASGKVGGGQQPRLQLYFADHGPFLKIRAFRSTIVQYHYMLFVAVHLSSSWVPHGEEWGETSGGRRDAPWVPDKDEQCERLRIWQSNRHSLASCWQRGKKALLSPTALTKAQTPRNEVELDWMQADEEVQRVVGEMESLGLPVLQGQDDG